jgi:SAM-dependent methyltransferase
MTDTKLPPYTGPSFWDERYSNAEYAFGKEPNSFFKEQIDQISAGKLLLPAEGEGRNAVYAATKGWEVKAFDLSIEGRRKALKLSQSMGVEIEYQVSDMEKIKLPDDFYDAIGLVYIHFPEDKRTQYHHKLINCLKPGGVLILECFSKDQLNYNSGGPKEITMLLSKEDLKNDFNGHDIIKLDQEIIVLQEGSYHKGEASVVRLVVKKR